MTNPAPALRRRITSHDLYRVRFVRDPRVSPDGQRAALVITAVDRADNRYRSNIWLVNLEGEPNLRRLTAGSKSDSSPRWSPDGRRLAFLSNRGASGEREEAAGGGKPQIWLLEMNGGEARQLTFVRGGVSEFSWSPDGGRIVFSASVIEPALLAEDERSRKLGAGKLARNSALGLELTEAEESGKGGGDTLDIPGERSSEEMSTPLEREERASAVDEEKDEQNKTRIITRMQHKFDGGGWLELERGHIFVIDVPTQDELLGLDAVMREHDIATTPRSDAEQKKSEADKRKERDPRDRSHQLTGGDFEDGQPRWSPDGQHIAFVSNRVPDWDWQIHFSDIFLVSSQPSDKEGEFSELRQLTPSYGSTFYPAFSPDGKYIAYYGNEDDSKGGGGRDVRLWVVDVAKGQEAFPRCLTEQFNRTITDHVGSDMHESVGDETPVWSSDSRYIYFPAGDGGNNLVFRIAVNPSEDEPRGQTGPEQGLPIIRVTPGDREVMTFSLTPDGQHIVFCAAEIDHPADLYIARVDGSEQRRLTEVNAALLNEVELGTVENVAIERDGVRIEGWLLKPPGFDPAKKYPMILEIHGGPHTAYGNTFHHEFQLMAARDYVVFYTNPRGSQNYGEAFSMTIRHDWGNVDYDDIMALVDKALENDYIDQSRLGVTGGSYGGYMTNWIIGHTNRFKAAVTQRSLSNLVSFWGTTDAGVYFGDAEFPGHPFDGDNIQFYIERSPITYVNQMETPLLILHSEKDYRCMIEQAEQLFVALKHRRKEVEMVRFPNESHGLSRMGQPRHRIERLERIIGWFDAKL